MSATITGDKALLRKLAKLEKAGAIRANRKATRAGTMVLLRAVRAATPVDEGLLRKAQASKVGNKGLNSFGMAGADVAKLKADSAASGTTDDGSLKRPTNIDALVEFGHIAPDGTVVPPSGHMRRAEREAMPAALSAYTAKLATEIEKEALK